MVSWETLPKAQRARITRAVTDALAAKLTAIANEDGVSPGPPELDAVAVTGSDDELTVHFVAHKQIRSESFDREGAAHALCVGQAVSAPNQPVTITLTEEHCEVFTEQEWEVYAPSPVLQRIREQVLARVQGLPVPPASDEPARARKFVEERAREAQRQYDLAQSTLVIRCPRCGSTRAGAEDYVEEYTVMKCLACGHRAFIEDYEIATDWNVRIILAPGEAMPAFLPPLPPPVERDEPPLPTPSVEPPAATVAQRPARVVVPSPAPMWPYDEPAENLAGDSWTKDVTDPPLCCPRCDSTKVYNDTGRAERHFTFLSCRTCGHGEEMSSLSATGRWRRE